MKSTLFVNGDLYHSSLLIAALTESENVSLNEDRSASPSIPRLEIGGRVLAFDLRDQSYSISVEALERADFYFKRSYYAPHLQCIPEALRAKILPFGLNCALRTARSQMAVAKLLACNPARMLRFRNTLRTYMRLPSAEMFERAPRFVAEQVIYFQTRVWERAEVIGDDFQEINETRVGLVRSLRRAFGARFKGGLIPTDFAHNHYPDALSPEPFIRSKHIQASRSALIGIYTRGLHHSLAFKLTEYLAGSQCVVAEPLRNALPAPLLKGMHYLEFRNVDECAALCDNLLTNPKAAQGMREANWDYYRHHVRFDQRLPGWLFASDRVNDKSLLAIQAG